MGFDAQLDFTYRFYFNSLRKNAKVETLHFDEQVVLQSLDFEKSPVQIVDWLERSFAQLLVGTKGVNGSP